MKEFGAGAPIVFTGDHNCCETEAPALAVSKLLKNALYESETPPTGPWRTFNGWKWLECEVSACDAMKLPIEVRNSQDGSSDGVSLGTRIDYIYVSPDVRVLDYATVPDPRPGKSLYPSDHFPIIATVSIP